MANGHYLLDEDAQKRLAPTIKPQRTRRVQEMIIPSDFRRRRERRIPWLSISGRWLEHAGFTPGVQTTIHVRQGCITIEPATAGLNAKE